MRKLLCITALATGLAISVSAQSGGAFHISSSTIDGGGGTSSGGAFSVSGTIGQPDAGRMAGGAFAVAGGFWTAVQTPGAPLLRITRSGSNVILSWPETATGWRLQLSAVIPAADAAWVDVVIAPVISGGEFRVTVPIAAGHRFFRLRKP